MQMFSGRTAPPTGESPLDARLCAEIGAELARIRQARTLSIAQVSDRLLLSIRQVKALEQVDVAAFHNPAYYVKALTKYAKFAGLDPAVVMPLASATTDPPSRGDAEAIVAQRTEPTARRGWVVLLALLTIGAVTGGEYLLWGRSTPAARSTPGATPSAAVPARAPALPDDAGPSQVEPMTRSVPAATPAAMIDDPASHASAAFGSVRVQHPTWIFVRDADSNVTERWLAAGEAFELESQPTYLAIGITDVEVTIGGQRLDLSSFVANGEVRIRAGDFDALVQGASPIPAPTAVVVR